MIQLTGYFLFCFLALCADLALVSKAYCMSEVPPYTERFWYVEVPVPQITFGLLVSLEIYGRKTNQKMLGCNLKKLKAPLLIPTFSVQQIRPNSRYCFWLLCFPLLCHVHLLGKKDHGVVE